MKEKKVLVIRDWGVVADIIWREFQGTGVSYDVATVLIEAVYEKLSQQGLASPGNLLAEFEVASIKDCYSVLNDLIDREERKQKATVLILEGKK